RQIADNPEGEREEVRQIAAATGFSGDELENVVAVITSDRDRWVNVMMSAELGYGTDAASPLRAAAATFAAFIVIGSLPLAVFFWNLIGWHEVARPGAWSAALTALGFFLVGSLKARVVETRWWAAGLETLAVGGLAAGVAFAVGLMLEGVG
ncbi:MAG: VIT1/CCC1 transporter family protein, partial [Solirubrobacterales bacterium]